MATLAKLGLEVEGAPAPKSRAVALLAGVAQYCRGCECKTAQAVLRTRRLARGELAPYEAAILRDLSPWSQCPTCWASWSAPSTHSSS